MLRTFPESITFNFPETIHKLRRMLRAFVAHNPSIGYVQGLNYICGWILIHVEEKEEEAFKLFCFVIERIFPPNYFDSCLMGLSIDQMVLERLIEIKLPLIHNHFQKLDFLSNVITRQWLMSAFINVFPPEVFLSFSFLSLFFLTFACARE